MKTCYLLSHIFIFLLMCDYGMFSTLTSLPLHELSTASSNINTSDITMIVSEPTEQHNMTHDDTTTLNPDDEDDDIPSGDNDTETDNSLTIKTFSSSPTTTQKPVAGKSDPENKDNQKDYIVAIIILIFILILIILLLGILYFLRKKGRSYSFNLTSEGGCANDYNMPLREQQVSSYEPKDRDLPVCLDYTPDDKSLDKAASIVNGYASETTASPERERNLPEESSYTSSLSLTPPVKKVDFKLDLDMISVKSEQNSPTSADPFDPSQNENNNNISFGGWGSEDFFTEISLDEPKHQA